MGGKEGWKRWIIWRCQAQTSPGTTPEVNRGTGDHQLHQESTRKRTKSLNLGCPTGMRTWAKFHQPPAAKPGSAVGAQSLPQVFWWQEQEFNLFYTEKRTDSPNYTRFPKYGSGTTLLIIARDLCKKLHYKFNVKIGFSNRIWIIFFCKMSMHILHLTLPKCKFT